MRSLSLRGFAAALALATAATGLTASPVAAAEPTTGWTASVGSNGNTRYFDSAAADGGAVVFAGWEQSGSETDGVVRKLDADGNQVWKTLVGADGAADYIDSVDVGPDGSVFVAGRTRGDLGGRTGGTDFDAFVTKLSAAGTILWTAQIGQNGVNNDDVGTAVAGAPDGSVFLAATVSFSANPAVLRFDSSGNELWRYAYGQPGDRIEDMAYNETYGAAYFSGVGTSSAFLISASLNGTMSSTTRMSGPSTMRVAIGPDDDVVAGGDGYLGRFSWLGINKWAMTSVPHDIDDVAVESDGSIVAFTETSTLRGFTSSGSLEGWSKGLAAPEEGLVEATSDGGIVTSSIDGGYNTVRLARFDDSSTGEPPTEFTDVPPGAYYSDAVAWLKDQGITTGTSATTYSPDDVVTRAQMAAFLHRLAGEPAPTAAHGFSDVPAGTFYSDAVAWLKSAGITTGTSATTYSPDDVVTRAQMAAFLHRLAGSPEGNPAHGFSDVPGSSFYAEAVRWLKDQGITTGTSASTYSPDDVVSRAQMAAFLYRMATDSDWEYPGG